MYCAAEAVVHVPRNNRLSAGARKGCRSSLGNSLWANAEQRRFVLVRQRVTPIPVVDLEGRTVVIVGSAFGDIIHHGSGVASILRTVVRQHLDFGDGVLIAEENHGTADGSIVVTLSVKLKVVVASSLTVRGELCSTLIAEAGVASRDNARREQSDDVESISYG